MLFQFLWVILGFLLLAKGADGLVEGASAIAKRCRVSDLMIGLTIVALGTSAPELMISTMAAIRGDSGIALGNVIGSNIANTCLVTGIAGLVVPITIRKGILYGDVAFCIGGTVLMATMLIFFNTGALISRTEGILLLLFVVSYVVWMLRTSTPTPGADTGPKKSRSIPMSVFFVLLGLAGLLIGAELIVRNAVQMATAFGVSQTLIGISMVALGTSLPELAIATTAVLKGRNEIALGNIIGSNIVNIGLVLGLAATIKPLNVIGSFTSDAAVLVVVSLMLCLFMFNGKNRRITRREAATFIVTYGVYMFYVFRRG